MSKKSAKSKGYRYYKKEKPFLTKKEIYALIAIVAVILVAFIAFLCYDDGALKIKNGAIEGLESNWIVANGNTSSSPRYFKLGEAGDVEGYTQQTVLSYTDYNLYDIYYYPEAEDNPIEYASISTTTIKNSSAADLGKTVIDTLKTIEGYEVTTELTEARAGDVPYSYYAFTTETYVEPVEAEDAVEDTADASETTEAAEAAEETENAPNTFGQSMNAYVEGPHDGCMLVHVINETDSPEEYLSDDEMKAVLEQFIAAITIEDK